MLAVIKSILTGFTQRAEHCRVYCPECRAELVSGGDFISDDAAGVHYVCASCGAFSIWDFDAPCPVLLDWTAVTREV